MSFLIEHGPLIFAVLFGISEALSLIPQVRANGVFMLVFDLFKRVKESLKFPPPPTGSEPPAPKA